MNNKIIADSLIMICFIQKKNPFEKAIFEDKQHKICFLTSFNQEKFALESQSWIDQDIRENNITPNFD